MGELRQHRVGDRADAELQRGAVGNELGHASCDRLLGRPDAARGQFDGPVPGLHENVRRQVRWQLGAVRPGSVRVDLGDDDPRVRGRLGSDVVGKGEAVGPSQRWRELEQNHVEP